MGATHQSQSLVPWWVTPTLQKTRPLLWDDPAILDVFRTRVVAVDFPEINSAYAKADRREARTWAAKWMRDAEKVGPSTAEIEKSAAMYLPDAVAVEQIATLMGLKLVEES